MLRAVVVAASLMLAGSAAAKPARLVTSGEGCDVTGLPTRISNLVGTDPFSSSSSAAVFVDIGATGTSLVARISLDAGDGRTRGPRIVRAESCDELLESVAIVVAMALPELDTQSVPSGIAAPMPEIAEAPTVARAAIELRNDTMTSSNASEPVFVPQPGIEADVILAGAGAISADGVGGQLLLGARWRRASRSIGVELRTDTPESHQLAAMGRVDVFRFQVTASPCVHIGTVGACGLLSLGTVYGSGSGLQNARSAFTPLAAGGVRLSWRQAMTARLALQLHTELTTLFTRTEFDVDQMSVWSTSRVEGSIGAGIVARFL